MKILAIDTSGEICSVAIINESEVVSEFSICCKNEHSERLTSMIQKSISTSGYKMSDIDVYAVSNGPGSFTGLRIGVTTIKALGYANKKPVIGIPSLDAIAYNVACTRFAEEYLICPIIDARNLQVYTSIYEYDNYKPKRVIDYMGIPIYELINIINDLNKKIVFVGNAVTLHTDLFSSKLNVEYKIAGGRLNLPSALSVALLALTYAPESKYEECFNLTPFYLRKSQAERLFKK